MKNQAKSCSTESGLLPAAEAILSASQPVQILTLHTDLSSGLSVSCWGVHRWFIFADVCLMVQYIYYGSLQRRHQRQQSRLWVERQRPGHSYRASPAEEVRHDQKTASDDHEHPVMLFPGLEYHLYMLGLESSYLDHGLKLCPSLYPSLQPCIECTRWQGV